MVVLFSVSPMYFLSELDNYLVIRLFTRHYLGSSVIVDKLLNVVEGVSVDFPITKWGLEENAREQFDRSTIRTTLCSASNNRIYMSGTGAVPILIEVSVKAHRRAKFNTINLWVGEEVLERNGADETLLSLLLDFDAAVSSDYGYVAHRRQERRQIFPLTPAERLPGIYWANLFGRPYVDFFGFDRLSSAPCNTVTRISNHKVVLLAAASPEDTTLLDSDHVVTKIKRYLDRNAFATAQFPREKCETPVFDFTEVRDPQLQDVGNAKGAT